MISQADIIKTLVNKNCTDESVMTVALSPDCTPPKLLEKLTEAERFDLALDVSMKLGLDVMPLWRTWAMRCLQNYNFQAARDKFRHCFVRFRQPGCKTSPMRNKLLTDILRQLSKMDDTKMPLLEEIELIKRRATSEHENRTPGAKSILSRPIIYEECCWYLREYGNPDDWIRFYVKNSLWAKAVEALLSKSVTKSDDGRFFLTDVVLHSTSRGHLGDLIRAFMELDPPIVRSVRYFRVIYTFCLRNRRYNLLYYVQSTIRDHIAAANTLIEHMFLKRPVSSYRELNHRIGNLALACKEYRDYIDTRANGCESAPAESLLEASSLEEIEDRIGLVETQIEITRNFAINEISGCINAVNLHEEPPSSSTIRPGDDHNAMDQNSPVTLFDTDERRKTFLAALVLMYFDVSCSAYLSRSGLDLANKLISDHGLDKVKVFKTAMRIILEDESCDIIENAGLLLERIREDFASSHWRKQSAAQSALIDSNRQSEPEPEPGPIKWQQNRKPAPAMTKANKAAPKLRRSKTSDKPLSTGTSARPGALVTSEAQNAAKVDRELAEGARAICDEVIRDSIDSCSEPDYKMELVKLLSGEAKIELYIEHGKLSDAQRLACSMNRPDYVSTIIEEATRLNQNHVKTVCQFWLARHETKNS